MTNFEKQQNIESIKTVITASWFFASLAFAQVILFKLLIKSLALASLPIAFSIMAVVFFFNSAYLLYLRRPIGKIIPAGVQAIKVLQITVWSILVSLMLFLNGTVNSLSAAFFLIIIMTSSVLYKKKGVWLITFLISIFYAALATAEYLGYFVFAPNPGAIRLFTIKEDFVALERALIAFIVYASATAFLSSYIADLFRRREKRLLEQRDELLEKTDVLTQRTHELTQTKNSLNDSLARSDKLRLQADEARLAQENEKNKVAAVLENLTDGLLMLNQKGEIIMVNKRAEKMLQVKKEKVVGRPPQDCDSQILAETAGLLKSWGTQQQKNELIVSRDQGVIFEISTADVLDVQNKFLGQLIVFRDITREKAIDRLKSEFVTIAAHQLRTPLSAVKWALNLVLEGDLGKVSKKQQGALQRGYESNERMIILINDLLNVSRIEEGRFVYDLARHSFIDLIYEAIGNLQEFIKEKNINIDFDLSPDDKFEIAVDKEKMRLALQNLIENAVNYSPVGSTVRISLARDKNNLIFYIKDQGIGIPKNQIARVYSKFFRGDNAIKTQTEGTGLGLFIVKNVVEGHGGKIWFETEEGKGSVFFMSLPVS